MSKKTFATLGMLFSILIVIMGVLVLTGEIGDEPDYASSSSYLYDSGFAEFGADFYTYVSNNAAEAANATRTAANNIKAVWELLKNVCGIFLIGFGLLGYCHFGIQKRSTDAPPRVLEETVYREVVVENPDSAKPVDQEPVN